MAEELSKEAGKKLAAQIKSYFDTLKAERTAALANDWEIPEPPPDDQLKPHNFALRIERGSVPTRLEPAKELEDIQAEMQSVMLDYVANRREKRPLLVNVPAGGGKTHAGVQLVQTLASEGKRSIWFSQRVKTFQEDITQFGHFTPPYWYNWIAIQGQDENGDPVCRYASAQERWANAGYVSRDLCKMLCANDGHIHRCPYLQQKARMEPIVFARHNHISYGVPLSKFDLAIIDELPLGAFVKDRRIPLSGLNLQGAASTITNLLDKLQLVALQMRGYRVSGRKLFEEIAREFDDVLAHIEISDEKIYPKPPVIHSKKDLENIAYHFFQDFVKLAIPEYTDYEKDKPYWAERIWMTKNALHMLTRLPIWDKLPRKTIILDATGDAEIYRQILNRGDPILYRPRLKRAGKIFQVVGRSNGKSKLLDKGNNPNEKARELIYIVRKLIEKHSYQTYGIICHLPLEPFFKAEFGDGNVRHFGAIRGTNEFENREALFICGSPAPNMASSVNTALAIDQSRREPFGEWSEAGEAVMPYYVFTPKHYILSEEGIENLKLDYGEDATGASKLIGRYQDDILETVCQQAKRAELEQALHRSRVNRNPNTIVWLLTSLPTTEPVDHIYDQPPIGPEGIHWQLWIRMEPWLKEQREKGITITNNLFAEAMGTTEVWARENKWLEKIAEKYPNDWEICLIPTGRRPRNGLAPICKSIL
jgi:hypothetical protein